MGGVPHWSNPKPQDIVGFNQRDLSVSHQGPRLINVLLSAHYRVPQINPLFTARVPFADGRTRSWRRPWPLNQLSNVTFRPLSDKIQVGNANPHLCLWHLRLWHLRQCPVAQPGCGSAPVAVPDKPPAAAPPRDATALLSLRA